MPNEKPPARPPAKKNKNKKGIVPADAEVTFNKESRKQKVGRETTASNRVFQDRRIGGDRSTDHQIDGEIRYDENAEYPTRYANWLKKPLGRQKGRLMRFLVPPTNRLP